MMDHHPIKGGGGGRNTSSRFMLQRLEISTGLLSHVARMQTLLCLETHTCFLHESRINKTMDIRDKITLLSIFQK